jgi:hypothetical protein
MLTTRADCQALIDIANAEKEAADYRKTGLIRQRQSASINAAEIEAELLSVNAELATLQPLLDTLPESPFKVDTLRKFKKSEYKKFLLEQRKDNYGALALLEKEYNIACVDESILETDAFITALTERMNALP